MKTNSFIVTAAALMLALTACAGGRSDTKNQQEMKTTELDAAAFRRQVYDYEKNPDGWKYEGDKPAVIDFYATWCGPCKMMAPVMETLSEEYAGKVAIYKVDVDKEQRLAALFGVRSIPTFVFIPLQGEPRQAAGAMDIAAMRRLIDTELLGQQAPAK